MNFKKKFLTLSLTIFLFQYLSAQIFNSDHKDEKTSPWTNTNFKNHSTDFNFAIVSDRSGGHRSGIFEDAINKINKLRPDFVVSIGDLIDTKDFKADPTKFDDKEIRGRWLEINNILKHLNVPFFYTVGNNDIRNKRMETHWIEQFGKTYYYFTYMETLFIILNTEDTPGSRLGKINADQLNWLKTTLKENATVKGTFIFIHRPMWESENNQEWQKVEEIIKDRPLIIFAGHHHKYSKTVKNKHTYYTLATTGGASRLAGVDKGTFDHFVWVSMNDNQPTISNLILTGIWGDNPPEESKVFKIDTD